MNQLRKWTQRTFHFISVFAASFVISSIAVDVACAQTWQPVPLVTAEMKRAGHLGGEGGQWPRAVAVDNTGNFVMFGSDVGGIFRSLNGGVNWEPCNVGYTPRGTAGMAIDPHNPNRVLSVGANSTGSDFHGIYLSTNKAASWQQVYKANIAGSQDNREQLAFDPRTYNAKLGYTRVVYWSRTADDKAHWGTPEIHPALYKSEDGGQTWREIPNTTQIGGSVLKVHPTRGVIYAANPQGFYRSVDGGLTWIRVLEGDFAGLDISRAAPDDVYLCNKDGVWQSRDSGKSFAKIAGSSSLVNGDVLRNVHVSPANAKNMILWREGANWQWKRFASHDGGVTWQEAKLDNTDAFLPYNSRQGLFVWHPKNARVAWSTGGDWPTRSTDGGATWKWSGDGYNVILVGGGWNFNQQDSDVVFFGSQDYNGALTTDGGKTWRYANPSGNGWGGFTYGGYAASKDVLFVGNAGGWGEPRELTVSRDGGKTWDKTGLKFSGPDVSYGDPTDHRVLFASNFRSGDGGQTWQPMTGCDAVYTSSSGTTKILWGRRYNKEKKTSTLVSSRDRGATWQDETQIDGSINDIAYDSKMAMVYAAVDGEIKAWNGENWTAFTHLPKDQWSGNRINSIALDPTNPSIIYAACSRDLFATNAAVLRSTDRGATWQNLTLNTPLNGKNKDGGREAIWMRVHPVTREAWVSTSCYGVWKIGPPATTISSTR